jgi:hypothetical protein
MDDFDFSHLTQWPPQPSTVTGVGTFVMGLACLFVGQIELAVPVMLAGLTMIGMPDSSTDHATEISRLHRNVSQLRYDARLDREKVPVAAPAASTEGNAPLGAELGQGAP